ncbi:hypothetical protein P4H65_00265 [Paenibacillus chitinolyticus]|uniref:hypothetical protein n=1 Tax=Paenibacillus chitinolyticus TaxID=79263 RepID=UPI002DBA4A34|nr:hypothetical protein [Paenibacillus chitinolyticus]MEC0244250.1 hypothetical protein [Paenibacillus chitinolyticus]
MIQINQDRRVNLDDIAAEHLAYYQSRIEKKIDTYLAGRLPREQRAFLQHVRTKLSTILIGLPEELERFSEETERQYPAVVTQIRQAKKPKKGSPVSFPEKVRKLFNYEAFTKRYDPSQWGAYRLAKLLGVQVCVYCNRQFTHTYNSDNGRVRPHFDHFLDKATHPYLAISMYNLIPSCSVCNSSLKGSETFSIRTHLHPFLEGTGEHIRFSVRFKGTSTDYTKLWAGNSDVFDIVLKTDPGTKAPFTFLKRAIRTTRTFKIKELYQYHKDYAAELVVKAQIYDDAHIRSLMADFPQLFRSREDVLRMLTANYTKTADADKRVLAKLTMDIAKEFGLS